MSFLSQLEWRYAVKKFSGEIVEESKIEEIKKAIQMSPSSFGTQPYHVVVVSDKEKLQELKKYAKNNEAKFDTCSHLFVFCVRTDVDRQFRELEKLKNQPEGSMKKYGLFYKYFSVLLAPYFLGQMFSTFTWSSRQVYIALGFALAACAELGVDSCPMEGFNAKSFHKVLNLPSHIYPIALLAIGVRAPEDTIYPKKRFSLEDLFSYF